jgi:hypothetical protein
MGIFMLKWQRYSMLGETPSLACSVISHQYVGRLAPGQRCPSHQHVGCLAPGQLCPSHRLISRVTQVGGKPMTAHPPDGECNTIFDQGACHLTRNLQVHCNNLKVVGCRARPRFWIVLLKSQWWHEQKYSDNKSLRHERDFEVIH